MADKVLGAMDNGEVEIIGSGHDKILRHWLENLRDWNVSRQIVWGIRMPVWYPTPDLRSQMSDVSEYVVQKESPGEGWVQETDTFDTWFSSGQWPFVTLKTTKEGDFDKYYPTQVMGQHDILLLGNENVNAPD
jgi:valyl-tRNA synthetase